MAGIQISQVIKNSDKMQISVMVRAEWNTIGLVG